MKTYVFDASAVLAFLEQKPSARKVNELLKDAMRRRSRILMSAVNYGEVYSYALREYGAERARTAIRAVFPLPISVVDATPERALAAAEVKARYKLYYADSFAAALCFEEKGTLVTSDSDFRRLGHGFPAIWLKS
ncbi:MAG TPA: type II toxin-antitoxin system VapC family toxin [Candidatus Binatia bacterium]|nr:type II toxin-antitoxin system VapC family toxin [Candidatus Binatia bacterium]